MMLSLIEVLTWIETWRDTADLNRTKIWFALGFIMWASIQLTVSLKSQLFLAGLTCLCAGNKEVRLVTQHAFSSSHQHIERVHAFVSKVFYRHTKKLPSHAQNHTIDCSAIQIVCERERFWVGLGWRPHFLPNDPSQFTKTTLNVSTAHHSDTSVISGLFPCF